MVDIIFANTCEKLLEFSLNDYIYEVLCNLGHSLRVNKENLFLVTTKGEVCEDDKRIEDYLLSDEKVLILFQKSCIISDDVFLDQLEVDDFNLYPEGYESLIRFDMSDMITENDEIDTIKTNEEILYEITEKSRSLYAYFFTKRDNILKNIETMKNRKRIAQSLCLMSENNLSSLESGFEVLKDQMTISQREVRKMNEKLRNQNSESFLVQTLTQVQEELKSIEARFVGPIKKCCFELRQNMNENHDRIFRLQNEFNGIKIIKKTMLDEIDKIEGEIGFCLIKTNKKYKKFYENLEKLTDFNYHPKTVVANKLMDLDRILKLYSLIDQMNKYMDFFKSYQNTLKPYYERIEPLYKSLLNFLFSFNSKFVYLAKKKFDKFHQKLQKMFQKQKSLHELINSPALETKLLTYLQSPASHLEAVLTSSIYEKIENLRTDQSRFLEKHGKTLPSRGFLKLIQKLLIKDEKREENPVQVKIPTNIATCSEVEINKFYQEQLKTLDQFHRQELKKLNENVKEVQNEVDVLQESIDTILDKKVENQEILENAFEENSLFAGKENIDETICLKCSFLKFRFNSLVASKMETLQSLRKKNKQIMNPYMNSYKTPR